MLCRNVLQVLEEWCSMLHVSHAPNTIWQMDPICMLYGILQV